MTKIKLCGLSRECDIEAVNELKPDYIGFIFAPKSRRYVTPEKAALLKEKLNKKIQAVGVFVNETPENIIALADKDVIDVIQLHGAEDNEYIKMLRTLTDKPIIKAFRIDTKEDVQNAQESAADYILLDSGNGGTGTTFDWELIKDVKRPYFLAGGLHPGNVEDAVRTLAPYAVDVSSGIETDGYKDPEKMKKFVENVCQANER